MGTKIKTMNKLIPKENIAFINVENITTDADKKPDDRINHL